MFIKITLRVKTKKMAIGCNAACSIGTIFSLTYHLQTIALSLFIAYCLLSLIFYHCLPSVFRLFSAFYITMLEMFI